LLADIRAKSISSPTKVDGTDINEYRAITQTKNAEIGHLEQYAENLCTHHFSAV
jgi:hypothetical protein